MIDVDKLNTIFKDCLFDNEEVGEDRKPLPQYECVLAKGIIVNAGFHKGRLMKNKGEIVKMIDGLSPLFKTTSGGQFLKMCIDKNNRLWTWSHLDCNELLLLGIAIGKIKLDKKRYNEALSRVRIIEN